MLPEPPICSVLFGFWLEIADDHSFAELFDLGGGDGSQGRPMDFPVKRIPGVVPTGESKPTYNATFFAARAWALWAREEIAAGRNPFDGDGTAPLWAADGVDALALMFDSNLWTEASDDAVEAVTQQPKRRKPKG